MLYLITGGSGSGKSEYAENLAVQMFRKSVRRENILVLSKESKPCEAYPISTLYYLATMHSYDKETHKRIERHQAQRAGKGFTTIECDVRLEQIKAAGGDIILLEDLSNLLANEMYLDSGRIKPLNDSNAFCQLERAVLNPVLQLEKSAGCVIIVTNEIFSDGLEYDEDMKLYIKLLGILNRRLGETADGVVEVVCGIPVWNKGGLHNKLERK